MSACWIARLAKGKLDMEVVLNSTLAGGVAMGSAADLIDYPFCSMIVGFVTGAISALGFIYLGPWLKNRVNLHDTCGVHNLHGIPGIIGGFVSAITAAFAGKNFITGSDAYDNEFT
jgi:ammonium transporter Rh